VLGIIFTGGLEAIEVVVEGVIRRGDRGIYPCPKGSIDYRTISVL
jgi:hypothetical protein